MATTTAFTPIQVVLDVRTYQDARVRTGGGSRTDFFEGQNEAFARHKKEIFGSLTAAASLLKSQAGLPVGFLKVSMRNDALAKSHRPISSLFPSRATAVVGVDDVGELLIQVTEGAVKRAAVQVEAAEIQVAKAMRKVNGALKEMPAPTANRAETSAIAKIALWGASDKRNFSVERALQWSSSHKLPVRYRVDLFDITIPEDRVTRLETGNVSARDIFFQNLDKHLEGGYFAISHRPVTGANERLYIWLVKDQSTQTITTLKQARSSIPNMEDIDVDPRRHERLLKFLDSSFMVRRITLPSAFQCSNISVQPNLAARSGKHTFSLPQQGAEYPVVGIVDGGLDGIPPGWILYKSHAVPPMHLDSSHGSEIASILIDGQNLNHPLTCPEPDGCRLVDLGLIPKQDFFSENYAAGDIGFLAALDVEVRKAKEATGARIFCFSHNVTEAGNSFVYDELSLGLDTIAIKNDVIFLISAGNLPGGSYRPEWKGTSTAVLSDLATANDDRIKAPADSIFNLSVAALNPHSLGAPHAGAPARYSRRGPGFKFTVKPDLTHFGGSGPTNASAVTGLQAVDTSGAPLWVHGTSFSGPLVAKTLARLDQLTKGDLTREALIALAIHSSTMPHPLSHKDYQDVKRDLVGFGMPQAAEAFLEGSPTSATLVFVDVLQPKKDLFFRFRWPDCLSEEGSCRGHAKVTLVYSPPANDKFGAEMIRINLDVSLQQYNPKTGKYGSKTASVFKSKVPKKHQVENELLKEGLKWNNLKQVSFSSKDGVGSSSDWRLQIDYLERLGDLFPEAGVPFAAIVTISDLKNEEPVYQDMRATLTSHNVKTEDIRLFNQNRLKTGQ